MGNVAEKLRRLRGKKTSREVSSELGISQSALRMYENGYRIPRDEIKVKIADYYHMTVQEIFYN